MNGCMGMPGAIEILLILFMTLIVVFPFWRIFSKAGFHGALSLLMLIPFVGIIMLFFLAFAKWPINKTEVE